MKWSLMTAAIGLGALGAIPAAAAQTEPTAAPAPETKDAATMAALDRMGAALRKNQEVNVHADLTAEDVLLSGQKLQYGGTIDALARRPNQLKMVLKLGPNERELYYDGRKVTLFAPKAGYYASFDAPATIREMLALASDKYGLEVPLADLFLWGEDPELAARVNSAFPAGAELINGQMCEHHALTQDRVDWQIWIRQGDNPLPCKLVVTSTDDPAMPQFSAIYTFKSDPVPGPEAFSFRPPEGSGQILFGTPKTSPAGN